VNSPSISSPIKETKRLRVFAGPNGSGKSTVIKKISTHTIGNKPIDFGTYINADDIAKALLTCSFNFSDYGLPKIDRADLISTALRSGLINAEFSEVDFRKSFTITHSNALRLNTPSFNERLAQILADYLREKLLQSGRKLSFETVFSHPSKINFMRRARDQGYKVYLYFVATEDPEINISRIKEVRIKQGGHDVPMDKIRSRYYRSLDLLYEAAQLTYQTFFFDNSEDGQGQDYFAHFKMNSGKKAWDFPEKSKRKFPNWFIDNYVEKTPSTKGLISRHMSKKR
jgi:predicted ABC-type ATPase